MNYFYFQGHGYSVAIAVGEGFLVDFKKEGYICQSL